MDPETDVMDQFLVTDLTLYIHVMSGILYLLSNIFLPILVKFQPSWTLSYFHFDPAQYKLVIITQPKLKLNATCVEVRHSGHC